MKKIIGIALVLAVIGSLAFGSAALAADPTEVDVSWDGAGIVDGSVTAGDDAYSHFHSEGAYQVGEYHAVDQNDNPYTYGVDTCTFSLEAALDGPGYAELYNLRTDTLSGVVGQESYAYVGIADGSATLQNRTNTNYDRLKDCCYGWHVSDHITVSGATLYTIERYMSSVPYLGGIPTSNYASLWASGSGDVDLDCMSSEASAGQVRLGWGCGCGPYSAYDGFSADGTGQLVLSAWGNTSATTAAMPSLTGAQSFTIIASWVNQPFTLADYYITAN